MVDRHDDESLRIRSAALEAALRTPTASSHDDVLKAAKAYEAFLKGEQAPAPVGA